MSLLFCFLSIPVNRGINVISSLNESNFAYSGYPTQSYDKNIYYSDIAYITLTNSDGVYIESDEMMTKFDVSYYGNYFTMLNGIEINDSLLNINECSISKNIASKYSIHIGDIITAKIRFTKYQYTVKYFFDECYGINDIDIFGNSGMVILGYNEGIIDNAYDYDTYYFSDENTLFSSDEIFVKHIEVLQIKNLIAYLTILILFICLLLTAAMEFMFSKNDEKDFWALRNYGLSKRRLFNFIILNSLIKYLSIYAIPLTACILLNVIIKTSITPVLVILFICMLLSIIFSVTKVTICLRKVI